MASPRLEASAQRCPSKAWPNRWHQCHRGRRASTRCPHDDGRREQGRPRAVTNPLQGGEFLALLFSGWIVFLFYFRESIQCQRREGPPRGPETTPWGGGNFLPFFFGGCIFFFLFFGKSTRGQRRKGPPCRDRRD